MTHNTYTNTTLINCLFDGSITGTSTNSCGGMIGYNDCTATLTNCVFKGSTNLASHDNATFARGNNVTVTNCYFSENLPGASGQGTEIGTMTSEELVRELGSGWEVKDDKAVPVLPDGVDVVNPVFDCVLFNPTASTSVTPGITEGTTGDGSVTFMGTYDPVEIGSEGDNTKLYLGDKNTLSWPNAAMSINACRAYFQLNIPNANVRSFLLNFGDNSETIGIASPQSSPKGKASSPLLQEGTGEAYTLDGRRLSGKPSQKGIYINNGKKVIIK